MQKSNSFLIAALLWCTMLLMNTLTGCVDAQAQDVAFTRVAYAEQTAEQSFTEWIDGIGK